MFVISFETSVNSDPAKIWAYYTQPELRKNGKQTLKALHLREVLKPEPMAQ